MANRSAPKRPPERQSAAEARAEAEARRAAQKGAREAALAARFGDGPLPGRPIIVVNWVATVVFVATAFAATIAPGAYMAVAVTVSGVLFALGTVVFLWALLLAAARSREDLMGMGGLFLLLDAAPPAGKWHLLGATGIQVVVSITTAAIRPFTPLAFGTLVPMLGIALTGLWAVRHGWFPRRPDAIEATDGGSAA